MATTDTRLRRLEQLKRFDAWLLALTPLQRLEAAMIGALMINLLANVVAVLAQSHP